MVVPADRAFDRAYTLALEQGLAWMGQATSRAEERLAEEARAALEEIESRSA